MAQLKKKKNTKKTHSFVHIDFFLLIVDVVIVNLTVIPTIDSHLRVQYFMKNHLV